ncbi:hypothetical protein [uncultured Polaribacter sp.]|uniref:hypothetical protein n=1 Tax=uncultured Polaribacter sp. TaxID=174711 RepID=UPI0026135A62|nr:hypothetical protein [uncultured Polaribacter sp.]
MKLRVLIVASILLSSISFSQEKRVDDATLKSQFDKIYRTSTSYQTYKVISKDKFLKLKQNVLDSLKEAKTLVLEKNLLLKTERDNIQTTKDSLSKTRTDLDASIRKENSISLFGLQLSKTSYNLFLWALILGLICALVYFIFKFSKNNIDTKEAQNNLASVELEYEQHRKKSLEREQKIRRQLQDEINKHRNI